jgi:hypothetical protein
VKLLRLTANFLADQSQPDASSSYAQQMAFVVLTFLILLYALPVIIAAFASLFGHLDGPNAFGRWFVSLTSNPEPLQRSEREILNYTYR